MDAYGKFESEVLNLLNSLKAQKLELQARHISEMAAIDQKIEAVVTTAGLLRNTPKPAVQASLSVIPDLRGLTIKDGCIRIAKKNDGIVHVKEAKDALIAAHVLRHTKHSWGVVATTLLRSKEFDKDPTIRGAFRLKDQEKHVLSVAPTGEQ